MKSEVSGTRPTGASRAPASTHLELQREPSRPIRLPHSGPTGPRAAGVRQGGPVHELVTVLHALSLARMDAHSRKALGAPVSLAEGGRGGEA